MSTPSTSCGAWFKVHSARDIRIEMLFVLDCPLVGDLRRLLDRCLSRNGLSAAVEEIEGPYPSPTLLINGVDAAGRPTALGPSCRLDLPTEQQIRAALAQAERGCWPTSELEMHNALHTTRRPPAPGG